MIRIARPVSRLNMNLKSILKCKFSFFFFLFLLFGLSGCGVVAKIIFLYRPSIKDTKYFHCVKVERSQKASNPFVYQSVPLPELDKWVDAEMLEKKKCKNLDDFVEATNSTYSGQQGYDSL